MAVRGRKPIPTQLKVVKGNPGRRPLPTREAKPAAAMPKCPAHLSKRAKKAWKCVAPRLFRMGILTEADGFALEGLCESYADLLEARAALTEKVALTGPSGEEEVFSSGGQLTYVTIGKGGVMIRTRPELKVISDADRRFRQWLTEFGITPAARSRVSTAEQPPEEDPAGAYFRRSA